MSVLDKFMDMMRLTLSAIEVLDEVQEYRAPADGMFRVQEDPWIMLVDWDSQLEDLHQFIWEESK